MNFLSYLPFRFAFMVCGLRLLTLPIANLGKHRPGRNHVFPLLSANRWADDFDSDQVQKSEGNGHHRVIG